MISADLLFPILESGFKNNRIRRIRVNRSRQFGKEKSRIQK